MANKITTTKTLGIGFEYISTETQKTKTVYLKIPNPKTNVVETTIKPAAMQLISGDNPILKTPDDEPFDTATAIATAYVEEVQKTEYDIGIE